MKMLRAITILSAVLAPICIVAGTAAAQAVRPSVVEYTAAAEGEYEVVNDSLLPMFVTVEAKSFTIDRNGVAKFTPLDRTIHLQLSQTSLRIPPRSTRTVYYKASAESYPAWFCVYSSFSGQPHRGGMNIALDLPHTVYMLSRNEARRDDVVMQGLHTEGGELRGTVRNTGSNMVRLLSLQWSDNKGHKTEAGGFPLLPGGERDLHIALPADARPEHLHARLNHGTADGNIGAATR